MPGPVRSSTACSGCGMSPTTLPRSLVIPAMSRSEPLGLTLDVAEHDLSLTLEPVEGVVVSDEATLAVLERDDDLVAGRHARGPRRRRVLDLERLVAADERAVVVADESAGQQVRLAQDLEAVADAQHRHAALGRRDDLGHDGGEAGDGSGAQVVAVGEAARQDDGVDALEVVVAVPQRDRLATRDAYGALRVDVVERTREGDDADLHESTLTE